MRMYEVYLKGRWQEVVEALLPLQASHWRQLLDFGAGRPSVSSSSCLRCVRPDNMSRMSQHLLLDIANKKLLGAPGLTTRSTDATRGSILELLFIQHTTDGLQPSSDGLQPINGSFLTS